MNSAKQSTKGMHYVFCTLILDMYILINSYNFFTFYFSKSWALGYLMVQGTRENSVA